MNQEDEMVNRVEQKYDFILKFNGENEVPLDLLSTTLCEFQNLSQQAIDSNNKCQYTVKATKEGSFEVDLAGTMFVVANIFSIANVNYIHSALSTIGEWLKVKQFLKGKPPKSVEKEGKQVKITNEEGNMTITDLNGARVLENAKIDSSIVIVAQNLYLNSRELEILGENREQLVSFRKNNIPELKEDFDYTKDDRKHVQKLDAVVWVKTACFIGTTRYWELFFNRGIRAKIEDDGWLKKVEEGEIKICGGTQLDITLRIETLIGEDGFPLQDTAKYYVMKVRNVIYTHENDKTQIIL